MGNFAGTPYSWGNGRVTTWIVRKIRPTYKLFPFIWYDLVEEKWETDGTHVPARTLTMLASRKSKKVIVGMQKLLKED